MSIKDKVHMKYVYQYSGSAAVQWPAHSSSRRTVNTGQPWAEAAALLTVH